MRPGVVLLASVVLLAPGVSVPKAQPARPELQSAPPDQDRQPGAEGWPCAGRPDPSYVRVAEATGGQLFLFHPSEAADAGVLMAASFSHRETLFRAVGSLDDGLHEFDVDVDSAIASLLLSVSVQCLQTVEIERPSGDSLQAADAGVDYHQYEAGRVVVVTAPEAGTWRIRASGRGLFFVVVQARSTVGLGQVRTLRPVGGTLKQLSGAARSGTRVMLSVDCAGSPDAARVRLLSAEGSPLADVARVQDVTTATGARTEWLGEFEVPSMPYRVAVTGIGPDGRPFERVHAPLFDVTAR